MATTHTVVVEIEIKSDNVEDAVAIIDGALNTRYDDQDSLDLPAEFVGYEIAIP